MQTRPSQIGQTRQYPCNFSFAFFLRVFKSIDKLSFKFPAATGARYANGKSQKILFQIFMLDDFVALRTAYFILEIFRSVLAFYFHHYLILTQLQQI
jgi:hypothetical protein